MKYSEKLLKAIDEFGINTEELSKLLGCSNEDINIKFKLDKFNWAEKYYIDKVLHIMSDY